ncbi:hypothetical protein [Tenacibaculum finnmarkense]|uniref:hypothetical protein n=1 Tax=Tenacibaculum finnmarkense TaxID=2781243 RepID=UPI00187B9976|nr:hypothetical protein [Tenacibaculum finnmarkense]MBE7687851.1 hypothetical protein [Tenacibaculum finnmarkense genomovar ulcerans]MCG8239195.1 hypothetical protein [Tenacibaculum finnmarkense genomovar ulcerans]
MPAPTGNKYTQKYTEQQATALFIKAVDYSKTNSDCLSVQDAVIHINMPFSTFYYLAKKYEVLDTIRQDINNNVIARINRGALEGVYNSSISIFRMKNLGEADKSEIVNTTMNLAPLTKDELEQAKKIFDDY